MIVKQPDAEPLPRTVVLGDERRLHLTRGLDDRVAPDGGNRRGCPDLVRVQCGVLRHLAHFELERTPRIEHSPAVALEPRQHRGRVLRSVPMVARVRRRAHPVVEDALGRRLAQVDDTLVEEPLRVRQAALIKRRPERLDPGVVLVEDVDAGGCGGHSSFQSSFGSANARIRSPPRRPRSPPPDPTVTNCSPFTI